MRASHLRSYRKFLWDGVRDADLRDADGEYFCSAADVATMLPLLEMASAAHPLRAGYPLRLQQRSSAERQPEPMPASERQQFICAMKIRALPRYAPLQR